MPDNVEDRGNAPSPAETAVKVALDLIPFVGGALSTIVEDHLERRRLRVRLTVEDAVDRLGGDETKLLDRLKADEDFADLFLEAVNAAAGTSLDAKRRAFAQALADGTQEAEGELDEVRLLIRVIDDLDLIHLRTMKRIDDSRGDGRLKSLITATPEPVMATLRRNGVVEESSTWDGPDVVTGLNRFGERVLQYVEEAGEIPPE